MCVFNDSEFTRLVELRHRYRKRAWSPEQDGLSLSERLGISMVTIPIGTGQGGVERYRCELSRSVDGEQRLFVAFFQVMPVYPNPPDAAELLAWLAGSVANVVLANDQSGWGLLHGITSQGRVRALPYRGLFHKEGEADASASAQRRRADELRTFLGSAGFQELIQDVAQVD